MVISTLRPSRAMAICDAHRAVEMKIAFVLEDVSLAGGHRNVFSLANHLQDRGHTVVCFAVNTALTTWMDIRVPIQFTGTYEELEMTLRGWDGALIATWWKTAAPVARTCAPGRGYYFCQDIETSYSTDATYKSRVLASYRLGLTPFTYGKWIQEEYEKLGLGHIERIGMAVEKDLFYPSDRKATTNNVVLFHERNHFLKGPHIRNQVLATVGKPFVMTGYSPWAANPNANDHLRGLSDAELAEHMRRSFAMLVTSVHEGFCLPALEAMTCGLPLVTTRADGNEEFCVHEENCLMGDSAEELVKHLHTLREDDDLWASLREGGLETAKRYDWATTVDKLEVLLNDD